MLITSSKLGNRIDPPLQFKAINNTFGIGNKIKIGRAGSIKCSLIGGGIKASMVAVVAAAAAVSLSAAPPEAETLSNIPQMLSGQCVQPKDCKKERIQRPKSRKAESCTSKCVTTCIQGGEGSPGEGPFNIRRPIVVFKEGFRSRKYCLVECSDICNLIKDGDDGP